MAAEGLDRPASPYSGTAPVASLGGDGGPVTLVEGQTFALSGPNGDMDADLPHGLFVFDTRVLSQWELRINGHHLEGLGVDVPEPYTAMIAGRAHAGDGRADADLVVFRRRHVGQGMRERIHVTNHGLDTVPLVVELICDADFAHVFEVKERRVPARARAAPAVEPGGLRFTGQPPRSGHVSTVRTAGSPSIEPGLITWRAALRPGQTWETCVQTRVAVDTYAMPPTFSCGGDDAHAIPAQRIQHWRATVPGIDSDDRVFTAVLQRAGDDLGALRIFDADHPELPVLAAGVPWFMTMFGRDSLLTAWMALIADPSLAHGVLRSLARLQGDDVDDLTEEQPGKILHEIRPAPGRGPGLERGDVYYGSVDATPLFVMLLGELRRWDPSDELVDALLPHADRALAWIHDFGDADGDGYVEYERRSPSGLVNQGWKDSWDAIRHADGTLARAPIALCEVQGYAYAAYIARAHFALEAGDEATHDRYAGLAADLRRRFNEDFWLDDAGTFALGLDADKRPIASAASNPAHCLWTGIVDRDKAPSVARCLLSDELFSGWGIRTLSTAMPAYNPVSYHNGSVWPHDNAIAAAGLSRYGLIEHAHRVIAAQRDVAAAHDGRLPELFAGFDRSELGVPAAYPASCSPQAWAAASPLFWLRTVLRLDPWAPAGRLWLAPRLPDHIGRLRVEGVAIGGRKISIAVDGEDVEVLGADGYEVIHEPRPPLTALLGR